jgi:hypothetical protein
VKEEKKPEDPRVRLQRGPYRVVAPAGKVAGFAFYVNGTLVVEKQETDALGQERWIEVERLTWREPDTDRARSVFLLLAGDAADKELR